MEKSQGEQMITREREKKVTRETETNGTAGQRTLTWQINTKCIFFCILYVTTDSNMDRLKKKSSNLLISSIKILINHRPILHRKQQWIHESLEILQVSQSCHCTAMRFGFVHTCVQPSVMLQRNPPQTHALHNWGWELTSHGVTVEPLSCKHNLQGWKSNFLICTGKNHIIL